VNSSAGKGSNLAGRQLRCYRGTDMSCMASKILNEMRRFSSTHSQTVGLPKDSLILRQHSPCLTRLHGLSMPAWQLHPTQGVSLKTHTCRNIGYSTQSSQCLKTNHSRVGTSEKGTTTIQEQHRDQQIPSKKCDQIIRTKALTATRAIRSYPTSGNDV
jgi:hypothetical protein